LPQMKAGRFFDGAANAINPAAVPFDAREKTTLRPPPVAIHNDGDMPRAAFGGNVSKRFGGGSGCGHLA
jgi:hypothetical protein